MDDLQGLETSGSLTLDTLNHVVSWLHQEGYYAAEQALLSECSNRFPDHVAEARINQNSESSWENSAQALAPPTQGHGTIELRVSPRPLDAVTTDQLPTSAEKVVEAWRSKASTPVTSPRKGRSTPPPLPFFPFTSNSGARSPSQSLDIDEYEDDDDVGYWRVPASAQDLYRNANFASPFVPDATLQYSLPKSPSTSSMQYSHSRHSSFELPLPLEPPVVGDAQRMMMLPPLPGSARSTRSMGAAAGLSTPQHSANLSRNSLDLSRRESSTERRHAGTAQWVFDRQNSAGSDAYKSLLSFLDQQSPRTQPLPLASTEASEGETGNTPRTPSGVNNNSNTSGGETPKGADNEISSEEKGGGQETRSGKQIHKKNEVHSLTEEEDAGLAACGGGLSRVSSLSESVIVQEGFGGEETVIGLPVDGEGLEKLEKSSLEDEEDDEELGSPSVAPPGHSRTPQGLKALKTNLQTAGTYNHHASPGAVSAAAATIDDESPCHSKTDLFSFPVTSPSERGERAPGPVFGSWPSFKNPNGSPSQSPGEWYCANEDEMTPGTFTRRGHRPRLSTASSSGNITGLPPVGPGLAIKFPQHVRRSSSQQGLLSLTSSTPLGSGQYGDLALYEYDEDLFEDKYDVFDLRVVHRRAATGFEPTHELPLRINDLIAGRYQIVDLLGQAAFCRAVQALDLKTGSLVCLKVVKNNKDYFDQSLDEIKVLRYINGADPGDEYGILRLYDYFYFKEHLVLVTELLRANLYEFSKHNRDSGAPPYFTLPRIQSVARQMLHAVAFLHSLGLIHADLKPENILMKSYSACEIKIIDLGSSCFLSDRLSTYVQSRSYRAPEVILGLPYGQKIDVWSIGCIIAELATGRVLFHNAAPSAILARIEGILGAIPPNLLLRGRYAPRYYTVDGRLYEKNRETGEIEFLHAKKSSLARRVPQADAGLLDFLTALLQVDPSKRPTAAEALQHPWLQYNY